ncbi:MAG TPA: helix-turn-helix transcriptional regulator [Stellaceae bacterium]|jgi:AraC-like DNA-binding protein|nr:helix-turn-helix transcriptional regulator [Stellaceae bacterium]
MKSTNAEDYQQTPRPFAGMPKDYAGKAYIAPHTHLRAQLTWAVSGVMTVTAAQDTWVVPPQRALWIPAGTTHAIRMSGPVALRSLYIDATVAAAAGERCKVILMSGLLRELVLEMVEAPLDYEADGRIAKIAALILDEIRTRKAQDIHLPMPRDRRLREICDALLTQPGRSETLEDWSETARISSRTLARLFARDLGMRFTDWRQQARLAAALARLAQGEDIATVARGLGYGSPSAFTAMFRKTLGQAPRDYFAAAAPATNPTAVNSYVNS